MKEQKWQFILVKWIILGLIFFVPILVGAKHLFPFTTSKGLVVIMGTAIAAAVYFWGRVRDENKKFSVGILDGIFLLFLGILNLTSFTGLVPKLSFFGSFEGMSSILVSSFIVFAFILSYLLRNTVITIKEILWTVLASALLGIAKIWSTNFVASSVTDAGFIGNSSYAGAYLLIVFFFSVALILTEKNKIKKGLAIFALLSVATSPMLFNINIFKGVVSLRDIVANPTLLGGVANGAVIGIVIGILVSVSLFLLRSKRKSIQWGGGILLIALFGGLWVTGQMLVNPEAKLHQWYIADKNANRFLFWDIAYAGVNERPLLGWGMSSYTYLFQDKFTPTFFSPGYNVEIWTNNPHNMIAEYAVSTGYIGLTVYILAIGGMGVTLFMASRSTDKTQRVISILSFGALTGYVVQNFFVFDTVVPLLLFYIIVGYSLSLGYKKTFSVNKMLLNSIYTVLLAGFVILFWVAGMLPWKESRKTAENIINDTMIRSGSLYSISAMGFSGDNALFAGKVVGMIASRRSDFSEEGKERARNLINVLVEDLQNIIDDDGKDNFRSRWVMGQLYLRDIELDMKVDKEKSDAARKHFEKALAINANNPLIYFDIAQSYAFDKDYKNAQKYIRAGLALAPEYKVGYTYAKQLVDRDLATKKFEEYVLNMYERWCSAESACSKTR